MDNGNACSWAFQAFLATRVEIHGGVALEVNHALSVYDVLPVQYIAMTVHHGLDTRVVRRGCSLFGKRHIHFPVFGTEAITNGTIV
jgi:hypothetical protein